MSIFGNFDARNFQNLNQFAAAPGSFGGGRLLRGLLGGGLNRLQSFNQSQSGSPFGIFGQPLFGDVTTGSAQLPQPQPALAPPQIPPQVAQPVQLQSNRPLPPVDQFALAPGVTPIQASALGRLQQRGGQPTLRTLRNSLLKRRFNRLGRSPISKGAQRTLR